MDTRELFNLEGKVALVTGGSRGLGLQIAEGLGDMGCKVAITARKADELAQAKQHLSARGIEVVAIANDLAKVDGIPAMVAEVVGHLGPIDILVNNAGATWGAKAEEYPNEAWRKVMTLNIDAVTLLDLSRTLQSKQTLLDQLEKKQNETEVTARLNGSNTSNIHWVDHAQLPTGRFN